MTSTAEIVYAIWDNVTLPDWEKTGCKIIGSEKKVNKYGKGTIVVCVNKDTKTIFGVGILGSSFVEHHLLDADTYSGVYAKYNRYEAELHFRRFLTPISFEAINRICDIRTKGVKFNSYTVHVYNQYQQLAYTVATDTDGPDGAMVAQRFRELVLTWI
jgi:hypothetical protein